MVSGLNDLSVRAELGGTIRAPRLSVSSNLDRAVAERLQAIMGEELAKAERRVRAKVDSLVDEKVDVTADWCITCQVNKKLVLEDGEVAQRLRGDGIVAMQADWTRPDDGIARYLASFGRYGIPFNAAYGPGAPQGLALPELLSKDAVLDALARVAGPAGSSSQAVSSVAE